VSESDGEALTVADKTAQTIYIDADPRTVMDVIADIGSYPEWVSEYTEAEVLETDTKGNPKVARLVLEAAVLKDTMVLTYEWPADRKSVRWSLVSSTLLKALDGVYILTPKGPKAQHAAMFGDGIGITNASKKKGPAWLYLQWATNKANQARLLSSGGATSTPAAPRFAPCAARCRHRSGRRPENARPGPGGRGRGHSRDRRCVAVRA
jgi:ribosome-associated toxin RatA of RatAB toxin-antitoxin module